jgi:hypothetical protein
MADAAKEAEVKLFMWSSLPNALALSGTISSTESGNT